jgi:SAM-dependent methyltransferase
MSIHANEIQQGERFGFGDNWSQFLTVLSDERIEQAKASLSEMLNVETLKGKTFIDIGSGSGIFSLAARLMGAKVYSFDYDPQSVACTAELKRRYSGNDENWKVETGSVLDSDYLHSLGQFDVVYSWGVLHHTGKMWEALANVHPMVKENGQLFIAIYNDQGRTSKIWHSIKKIYNGLPSFLRFLILIPTFIRLWLPTIARDLFSGNPLRSWKNYYKERGMNPWYDVVDWIGGYPFEVAKPEEIFEFYHTRGYSLKKMRTCGGGLGCNEFVFKK